MTVNQHLFNMYIEELSAVEHSKDLNYYLETLHKQLLEHQSIFFGPNKQSIKSYTERFPPQEIDLIKCKIFSMAPLSADVNLLNDILDYFEDILIDTLFCIAKKTTLFHDDSFFYKNIYNSNIKNSIYRQLFLCQQSNKNKATQLRDLLLASNTYNMEAPALIRALLTNECHEHLRDFLKALEINTQTSLNFIEILEKFPALHFNNQIVSHFKLNNFKYFFENFHEDFIWKIYQIEASHYIELDYEKYYKNRFFNIFTNYSNTQKLGHKDVMADIKDYLIYKYNELHKEELDHKLIQMDLISSKLFYITTKEEYKNLGHTPFFQEKIHNLLLSIEQILMGVNGCKPLMERSMLILDKYDISVPYYKKMKQFINLEINLAENKIDKPIRINKL